MRAITFPALALLTGCNSLTGIWLFEIPYQDASLNCDTTIQENFSDGYVPQGDGPGVSDWVYTDDYEGSDAVAFGQIETYGGDAAVLVIGTAVFTGLKEGDDWIFDWSDSEVITDAEEHYDGDRVDYGYLREDQTVSTVSYTFTPSGKKSAEVKVESTGTTTTTWYESDTWSEDLAFEEIGETGQIPSRDFLVYDDEGDSYSQTNHYEDSDCTSDVCQLQVETSCSEDGEFIAYKTDFEDEDHYRSMRESGQPAAR